MQKSASKGPALLAFTLQTRSSAWRKFPSTSPHSNIYVSFFQMNAYLHHFQNDCDDGEQTAEKEKRIIYIWEKLHTKMVLHLLLDLPLVFKTLFLVNLLNLNLSHPSPSLRIILMAVAFTGVSRITLVCSSWVFFSFFSFSFSSFTSSFFISSFISSSSSSSLIVSCSETGVFSRTSCKSCVSLQMNIHPNDYGISTITSGVV